MKHSWLFARKFYDKLARITYIHVCVCNHFDVVLDKSQHAYIILGVFFRGKLVMQFNARVIRYDC